MMIDIEKLEKIRNLTPEERQVLNAMPVIEEQAKESVENIRKAYAFKMGEKVIYVYNGDEGYESLSFDGEWNAHYGQKSMKVTVTNQGVYELRLNAYLADKGLMPDHTPSGEITIYGKALATLRYFDEFVARSQDILLKKNSEEKDSKEE
jgi:hypothetical protein